MSSTDLIKRAKNGDKQAFAQLYVIHKDSLYRYAYFKLGNQSDAQDAVSDCIAKAYSGLSLLKNEQSFGAWIFKILYRQCCSILNRNISRRTEASLDDCMGLSREDNLLAPELHEALAQLSTEDKDIVLLSVVAGYKTREIAEMLSLNHSTVRSRLSRALEKMKNFLE